MGTFLDIITLVASSASIAGVSLRDFLNKLAAPTADRHEIEQFLLFLEGREVLFAGMDDEVPIAVVRSLEEIKLETEALRLRCKDEHVHTVLLNLLLSLSKKLQKLHGIDASSAQGKYRMYLALQGVRFELARALALLCAAFQIEPQKPRMRTFVLDFSARPR